MTDIFEFWSRIGRGETVHPADREVFDRIDSKSHGFRTDCLPTAYIGRIRTAPVVLLYLSPGFDEQDVQYEQSDEGKDYYLRCWQGDEPLPNTGSAVKWLKSRTKSFADYKIIRDKVSVLNIGAYHSKDVKSRSLFLALPSSRASVSWAQNQLFPEAKAGNRIVICMRSAVYWGLEKGKSYGLSLFAPEVNRGGYLINNSENEELKRRVCKALE